MPINHTSQFTELTDDQYIIIGKIFVEWSNIEFIQKLILCRLLFTNEFLGRTFTDQISAFKVQEAIDEAIQLQKQRYQGKIIPVTLLDELTILNQEVTKIRGKRNKFAHFCWSRSNDEEIFGTNFSGGIPETKKSRRGTVVLSIKDMNGLYNESYRLVEKLALLLDKLPQVKEEELIKK